MKNIRSNTTQKQKKLCHCPWFKINLFKKPLIQLNLFKKPLIQLNLDQQCQNKY